MQPAPWLPDVGKQTFFHPDCTVGPGVSPDHAVKTGLTARGLYRRSGFRFSIEAKTHPAPKVFRSKVHIITCLRMRVNESKLIRCNYLNLLAC